MRTIHGAHSSSRCRGHRFNPGSTAWNKGIPGSTGNHPNTQRTQFKAGRRPEEARNYRPIGSAAHLQGRLSGAQGFTMTQTVYPSRRWTLASTGWSGKKPTAPFHRGHVVVFKPGMATTDPALITIDRVELITRAELMRRNTRHNLPPEINAN
jgi:hypothetical protein